jgi:hypothetical protein
VPYNLDQCADYAASLTLGCSSRCGYVDIVDTPNKECDINDSLSHWEIPNDGHITSQSSQASASCINNTVYSSGSFSLYSSTCCRFPLQRRQLACWNTISSQAALRDMVSSIPTASCAMNRLGVSVGSVPFLSAAAGINRRCLILSGSFWFCCICLFNHTASFNRQQSNDANASTVKPVRLVYLCTHYQTALSVAQNHVWAVRS